MKSIIYALAIAAAQAIQLKDSTILCNQASFMEEFRPLASDVANKLNADKIANNTITYAIHHDTMADVMRQLPKACMMVEKLKYNTPGATDWYNPIAVTEDDLAFIRDQIRSKVNNGEMTL